MRIVLAHMDDDGHYLPIEAQEHATIEYLVLGSYLLKSVEVFEPESSSLDVSFTSPNASARWSGIYQNGRVDLGVPVKSGDRIVVKVKNVGHGSVLARMSIDLEPSFRS